MTYSCMKITVSNLLGYRNCRSFTKSAKEQRNQGRLKITALPSLGIWETVIFLLQPIVREEQYCILFMSLKQSFLI